MLKYKCIEMNAQYDRTMPDGKYEIHIYFGLKNDSLWNQTERIWNTTMICNFWRASKKKNHNDDDDEIIFQNVHWIEVNYVKFTPKHDQCCSLSTELELWKRRNREKTADESCSVFVTLLNFQLVVSHMHNSVYRNNMKCIRFSFFQNRNIRVVSVCAFNKEKEREGCQLFKLIYAIYRPCVRCVCVISMLANQNCHEDVNRGQ